MEAAMKSRRPTTSTSSSSSGTQNQCTDPAMLSEQNLLGNQEIQRRIQSGPAISAAAPRHSAPQSAPGKPGDQWMDTGSLDTTMNLLGAADTVQSLSKGAQIIDTGTDFIRQGAPAGSMLGNGLSVLGAVNTALNHKASNTGTAGNMERIAVGGADLAASIAMGPLGVVDSLTGGHGSGVIKGGAEGLVSLATGDVDAMGRTADGLKEGKHGQLARGVAHVGDGIGTGLAVGVNALVGGKAPPDLGRAANSDWERNKEAAMRQDPRYQNGTITWGRR
jgi:hypothetical protein